MIRQKECASIYQFIVAAQSTRYVQEHRILKKQIPPSHETMAKLYHGRGEGFSEESVKWVYYSIPSFHQRFEWKKDFPKVLRFDPMEGQGCVVTALRVFSSGGELEAAPINGYRLGHTDFFVTSDPQYSIEVGDLCVEWVEILAQIEVLTNGQIQAGIAGLVRNCLKLEETQQKLLNMQEVLKIKEEQFQTIDMRREEAEASLKIKEEQLQTIDMRREEAEASLKIALTDLKRITDGYHYLECSIIEMRESKSWKVTKPFRFLKARILQWKCNCKLKER